MRSIVLPSSYFNGAAVHHGGEPVQCPGWVTRGAVTSTEPPFITAENSHDSVDLFGAHFVTSTEPPFITAENSIRREALLHPPLYFNGAAVPHGGELTLSNDGGGVYTITSTEPPFITAENLLPARTPVALVTMYFNGAAVHHGGELNKS